MILAKHSAEVHAVAQALLDRNDLTGKQCIEVIRGAAVSDEVFESEPLLKALVEETIIGSNNSKSNGKEKEKSKSKSKPKAKSMAKAK